MVERVFNFLRDFCSLASIAVASTRNIFRPNVRRLRRRGGWSDRGALLLVGNGPSAAHDLGALDFDRYIKKVGVNFLAATDWFTAVRPEYYFLQDRYWFETNDLLIEKARKTIASLNEKVNWDLIIIIPARSYRQFTHSARITNPRISIRPMTAASLEAGDVTHFSYRPRIYKKLIFKLWSAGFLSPPGTNIVSTALFELLTDGYKKIDVVGVDMTMAQDLALDANGKLIFVPNHFYGKAQAPEPSKAERDSVARAYEWLAKKFRVFDLLADYAVYRGAVVTNLSSVTLLDSFPWKPVTHRTEDATDRTTD